MLKFLYVKFKQNAYDRPDVKEKWKTIWYNFLSHQIISNKPTLPSVPKRCDEVRSLTGLNLSVSCGGQFWIESTDTFSSVLFRPLHGTLGFMTIYQSINVKFFEPPQCFTFRMILLSYTVSVLYSHYGDSISSKKLNRHQAFESMSLLGALIFLFKQHTSLSYLLLINNSLLSFNFTFIHLNSWKHCCLCCYCLQFPTKRYWLYFQLIRLQLRRYCSGYLWNRKLWRMLVDSIQALTSTTSTQVESFYVPNFTNLSQFASWIMWLK